jgi:SMC interacting uncharacterized protein involved in chromosome segregation
MGTPVKVSDEERYKHKSSPAYVIDPKSDCWAKIAGLLHWLIDTVTLLDMASDPASTSLNKSLFPEFQDSLAST